jgi:hypothetical protein
MAISEDVLEEDVEAPLVSVSPESTDITPPSDPLEVEPTISLNALNGFYDPQTLKLIGYIKHRKVIILVHSGSTHNFIHCHIAQETNCYICAVNNFQIMISNGGSMKCRGRCENVHLQIGEYHLKSHMFAIDMGGCDIVLGAEWLRTLGPILMDFHELTMQFDRRDNNISSKASPSVPRRSLVPIAWKNFSRKVILELLPNSMPYKKLRHHLCHRTSNLSSLNIKCFFPQPRDSLLPVVFMIIPFPSSWKAFLPISIPIVIPFRQKNEIEKMVQELLNAGVIHP